MSSGNNPEARGGNNSPKTAIILGSGASKSSNNDFPIDQNFFKSESELVKKELDKSDFKRLSDLLKYYPEHSLEGFFTFIETLQKWINFGNKIGRADDFQMEASNFFIPLPFLPLCNALDLINEENLKKFIDTCGAYKSLYDVRMLQDHQKYLKNKLLNLDLNTSVTNRISEVVDISVDTIKNQLELLILAVLSPTDDNKQTYKTCEDHKKLFKKYYDDGGLGVVSFNYDLIGDTALFKILEEHKKWTWDPEYLYFQLFYPLQSKGQDVLLKPDVFILKPHGSLNWLKNKKNKLLSFDQDKDRPTLPSRDYLLSHNLRPFIVPPLLDKLGKIEENRLAGKLTRMWTVFFDLLLNAEKWIFWGYSLPSTDFHTVWLIKSVLAYRRERLPKIIVINPEAEKPNNSEKIYKLNLLNVLKLFDCEWEPYENIDKFDSSTK